MQPTHCIALHYEGCHSALPANPLSYISAAISEPDKTHSTIDAM